MASGQTRRTVTAVFCDLVGSTSLAERHDPEELRPILERYFAEMRSAVERHGGRVEKFIGDAVVAVFGVPVAHEDDGLRAVRAGVEMHVRLGSLNEISSIPLAARIGVTSGVVVVSDNGTPIIGAAMNTAARLQTAADAGDVLVGEATWRLVRDAVIAEPVAPIHAKGKSEPVAAWRVSGFRPGPGRNALPMVGRARHLKMLEEALADAIDAGASSLVTVLGASRRGQVETGDGIRGRRSGSRDGARRTDALLRRGGHVRPTR